MYGGLSIHVAVVTSWCSSQILSGYLYSHSVPYLRLRTTGKNPAPARILAPLTSRDINRNPFSVPGTQISSPLIGHREAIVSRLPWQQNVLNSESSVFPVSKPCHISLTTYKNRPEGTNIMHVYLCVKSIVHSVAYDRYKWPWRKESELKIVECRF